MPLQEALKTVTEICNSRALTEAFVDAHTHTRGIIRANYPVLVAIDNEFVHSVSRAINPVAKFADLITEIQDFATDIDYAAAKQRNLQAMLASINAFVRGSGNGVEAGETNVCIPDILLRCWNLAKTHDGYYTGSARAQILEVIENNISDGGGCMAGAAARLFPAYAKLLRHNLEELVEEEFVAPLLFRTPPTIITPSTTPALEASHATEAEDLELALALSLSLDPNGAAEQEEQDLAYAIALSRRRS